jgi:hypothetical protein
MLVRPKMTIGVSIRKLIAFLIVHVPVISLYSIYKDVLTLYATILLLSSWVLHYIAKRIIYNDACKRYNFDLQFYKDAMMQKKLDKVRALKGNNVNENIANYKKRPW